MRSKLFPMTRLIVSLIGLILIALFAARTSIASQPPSPADDQQYVGTWVGSYSSESGGAGTLTYVLSKDAKGQWQGTVIYTNQDGEQKIELKAIQIAGGKFNAKIDSPDGKAEVTIIGEFQGTRFEGTYSVSEKGSTEIAEKGTWKTTKSPATKTGQ